MVAFIFRKAMAESANITSPSQFKSDDLSTPTRSGVPFEMVLLLIWTMVFFATPWVVEISKFCCRRKAKRRADDFPRGKEEDEDISDTSKSMYPWLYQVIDMKEEGGDCQDLAFAWASSLLRMPKTCLVAC